MSRRRRLTTVVIAIAVTAQSTAAQESEPPVVALRTSVKVTGLPAGRTSVESMFRLRIEPEIRPNRRVTFSVAYDQRVRHRSRPSTSLGVPGVLPSEAAPPFRTRSLVWRVGESGSSIWRHDIDRASAQIQLPRATLTVGRQAIGWGRGVMFTAVDLFAPFSPLEVDREWRSGVDAVRADLKLTERSSLDFVGAAGESLDQSVFGVRARGYTGRIDAEVMGGRRGRDAFAGISTSAALGDAEFHGEVATFREPDRHMAWKAVIGGSYRFPVGAGLLAYAEYHYSGFGAEHPEEIPALLLAPAFVARVLRADMQILSRHAIAITASYEISPEMACTAQWLHNPADGSGIVAPAMAYTLNDAVSLSAGAFLRYGRSTEDGRMRSEYGATPRSVLLQLRLYF